MKWDTISYSIANPKSSQTERYLRVEKKTRKE